MDKDEKPILKNIDGIGKRSRKWIQKYIEKIAKSIITNSVRDQILKAVSSIMQEAFSELELCWDKQVNIHDLRLTSRVSQDLDKYKSQTCQTVNLFHSTTGIKRRYHILVYSRSIKDI